MRLLALFVSSALSCAPPTDGAACLRHDNCPDAQFCANTCVCVTGERSDKPQACAGFKQESVIPLEEASPSAVVRVSSQGRTASVFVPANSLGQPEARQYQRQADGTWAGAGGSVLSADPTASPMGLSPGGESVVVRTIAYVRRLDLPPSAGQLDLWLLIPPERVIAVAQAQSQVVASFTTRGTFQKTMGEATSLPGSQLDPRTADELELSNDAVTAAARYGTEARRYRNKVFVKTWTGIAALDLSADGSSLALVRQNGEVSVEVEGRGAFVVPVAGVRSVALDGPGRTLLALGPTSTSVFGFDGGAWERLGELPVAAASGLALSDDGKTAFVGTPADQKVLVFTSFR